MEVILTLVLVGITICLIVYSLYSYYFNPNSKHNIRKVARVLLPKVEVVKNELYTLLEPNHRVMTWDIEGFQSRHQDLMNEVHELTSRDIKFADCEVPEYESIKMFELFDWLDIERKVLESNQIYDSIQALKGSIIKAKEIYKEFFSDNHYISFSEMEAMKDSMSEMDSLSKTVIPKYSKYLDDAEKEFIKKIDKVEEDRKQHNEAFIQRELTSNKTYFDTVLGSYPLDPQQRDSIVKLEDNCLVIASAGSGKTSTILGKAKYLVEKRNIDPAKVLLITYTRKAANELHERMKIDGMTCSTFHALAYQIIAQVTGQAPSISEGDVSLNVFHKLIETNGDFLHAVNNYIINQQSLMGLEHDYMDAFSYYEDRKKYGIQALFPDVDGKIIFTKSEEEKRLCSILTRLGVLFRYENPYEINTATPERRQYKPDFTIYYQDSQGGWKWLYLEHFAIDANGNVPQWFGDGERGGWNNANRRYTEGIRWKRTIHSQNNTTLIETTSADFRDGTVESKLREQLGRYGVPVNELSDDELYGKLVKRSKSLEKSVYKLILSFITLMKANEKTVDGLLSEIPETQLQDISAANNHRNRTILTDIIKPFYEEYEETLHRSYQIDFTDAIIQATELCRKGLWRQYEYILVDEFQDISIDRYKFLQALRRESAKTKLFCVGDDWQSIFRFAGSDMSLVYEFEKYFGYTEQCKIETTYRFHQPLIDMSSEFILKNKEQKEKTIKTPDGDTQKTYLNFVKCDGEDKEGVLNKVKEIVATIPKDQSILLLGRYNYDAMSVGFKGDIDMKDSRIMVDIDGRKLPFLSIHSAKGLEEDHVILINCNQGAYGFPSLIEDDPILDFVLSKSEGYPFAEERRLFYVAMTRARKRMYVLYDQKRPSPFISEFLLRIEKGSNLCPKCLAGKVKLIKEGETANGGKYYSYACSNREGGCDFFETRYDDSTYPGILITEEMTAQDVEKLREGRRKAKKQYAPITFPPATPTPTKNPVPRHPPYPFGASLTTKPVTNDPQQDYVDDLPF